MDSETFLKYLDKEDLLPLYPNPSSKIKNSSDTELKKLILKDIKEKKITASKIRKYWISSLNLMFFDLYQKVYQFTPTKKYDTTAKIKDAFQQSISSQLYVAKLNSKPLHYILMTTLEDISNFTDFLLLPLKKQIMISVFPELGLSITWPATKEISQKILTKSLSEAFENLSEVKVNALLLRKYSTQETITKLVISTPQEIAGFSGLDVIEFKGPNVVIGLSGLKRRHDANVDVITRVGPFTEIESDTISLICGKGIKISDYAGIEPLLNVLKS